VERGRTKITTAGSSRFAASAVWVRMIPWRPRSVSPRRRAYPRPMPTSRRRALVPKRRLGPSATLLSPCPLGRAPVVGPLFVVQVPNARDQRRVAHCLGPSNGFFLRARGMENIVGVVFDDIIGDGRSFGPALRSSFHKNVSHSGFTAWNQLGNSPSLKALGS
jgi:hypothetical protein